MFAALLTGTMTTAAQAVGEINTRFGATGEALENLSALYIKFADVNNTDVVGADMVE